jgi:hypothetical protein
MRCSHCGVKRTDNSAFCKHCGFHSYETWLIARQQNIKLYLACLALYLVLMVYCSL